MHVVDRYVHLDNLQAGHPLQRTDDIARHPEAVVLDLGAGLDTRAWRVEAPSTVDFYDIDLPEVVS
ncbi:hypothetical protein BJF90_09935 [Pseudonocardia sp. CNS-004]|nr:hypothetical protein BJF90_09935 [Pseudonocardia sp. CNS-004]